MIAETTPAREVGENVGRELRTRSTRDADATRPDEERARREQHQLPLAEKRQRSDHVIDNGGDLRTTEAAVAALLNDLESTT